MFFGSLTQAQTLDIQGHRGARGLLPENTIPAFIRAIEEGVSTLELDVVITKDKQVVVSHEPYMSSGICSKPDGTAVASAESKSLNIYQMTYEQVARFDCGSRGNRRFPEQQKMSVGKPLLKDLINTVEKYLTDHNLPKLSYNIEIKSSEKGDNEFHPGVGEFSQLVYALTTGMLPKDRFTIQSFDFRVLNHWHEAYPDITLVALIENTKGVESNLKALGFIPDIYSPNYRLLSKKAVELCHQKGMKVVPWTVNTLAVMKRLVAMGVDGLITDYPDRAKGL
ncbi:glycerophosphodiester phosphodiesterase [Roseivirga misakiensis]|uniref:Glycerophosphodiester phosphodiesterase n=1 Tax=Roseivirga misakiensis TaxID=1563681 RepID=A0A1E5T739_9BACT|nr:glycerophosphodiester phosphodiesterase [Roseivirga misakiensis]